MLRQCPSHRVGQGGHFPDALGHGGNPLLIQQQPVQHHLGHGALGGFQVGCVGGENGLLMGKQGVGHGKKGLIFLLGGQLGHLGFGGFGVFQHRLHWQSSRVKMVPTGSPSRIRYRLVGSFPLAMTMSQPHSMQISAARSLVRIPPVP